MTGSLKIATTRSIGVNWRERVDCLIMIWFMSSKLTKKYPPWFMYVAAERRKQININSICNSSPHHAEWGPCWESIPNTQPSWVCNNLHRNVSRIRLSHGIEQWVWLPDLHHDTQSSSRSPTPPLKWGLSAIWAEPLLINSTIRTGENALQTDPSE